MIKDVHRSSRKVRVSLVRFLMKLQFSRQIFEKYSNIKFHDNPSSGSRVPCGQTDGHEKKLIVICRNFAKAPKKEKCGS